MKSNFMTLMYRSEEAKGTVTIELSKVNAADYYAVTNMPLLELLSVTRKNIDPVKVVEELIELTSTVDWQDQLRRPVKVGDVICIGTDAYMLVMNPQNKALEAANQLITLPMYSNYAMKRLSHFSKDNECKVQH